MVCAVRNRSFIIKWELRRQNGLYGGVAILPSHILVSMTTRQFDDIINRP